MTHRIVVSGKNQTECLNKINPFYIEEIILTELTNTSVTVEVEDKSLADRIRKAVRR